MTLFNCRKSLGLAWLLCMPLAAFANNVNVTKVAMKGMNSVTGTTQM